MLATSQIMINAANEGIPVAAIARIVVTAIDEVYENLKKAVSTGAVAELPRADWPPGTKLHSRVPPQPLLNDGDLQFMCKKAFRLTTLEAGFLVVLLRHRQIEKARLHNIVEQQRATRQQQPGSMEATDPKMVDVMICKLRKKLKTVDAKLKIETIWGGGYYIENDVKPLILAHVKGETSETQESAAPAAPANGVTVN